MPLLMTPSRLFVGFLTVTAMFFAVATFAVAAEGGAWTGDVPRASYGEQAQTASARAFADVEDIICQEHVERYRTSRTGVRSLVDTIDAQVSVDNGVEQYSAIRQDGMERASLDEIGAAWSDSEYATFINDARLALYRSALATGTLTTLDDKPAILISFEAPQAGSSWDFMVRGRHFQLGYRGEIWVSQETGELLRCRRIADRIDRASGVKSIDWSVEFGVVQVAGKRVSVPIAATYDVQYIRSNSGDHNEILFMNYHRYAAETSIRFE